jgi:hypothetical protein
MSIKKVKPSGGFISGKYKPRNPEKYIGDINNIICRSSWETRFCTFCDTNEKILKWSSEPIGIPYYSKLDGRQHTYYVDFYIRVEKHDGSIQEMILEIKPQRQVKKPVLESQKPTAKSIKAHNDRLRTWITNMSKFEAAMEWAHKRGFDFKIVDENFLFKNE